MTRPRRAKRTPAQELARQRRLLCLERALWSGGAHHVAGVDEAGVGPLIGPVVAAAVILPHDVRLDGLDDSKKIKSEARREALALEIKAKAVAWCVAFASAVEIDRLNVFHASLLAMRRAVEGLATRPDALLVDARTVPGVSMPQAGHFGGDGKSLSIAAASILAKTSRDRWMHALDTRHPGWGFAAHKGYPAPAHLAVLKARGPLLEHRQSYRPVQEARALPR